MGLGREGSIVGRVEQDALIRPAKQIVRSVVDEDISPDHLFFGGDDHMINGNKREIGDKDVLSFELRGLAVTT